MIFKKKISRFLLNTRSISPRKARHAPPSGLPFLRELLGFFQTFDLPWEKASDGNGERDKHLVFDA